MKISPYYQALILIICELPNSEDILFNVVIFGSTKRGEVIWEDPKPSTAEHRTKMIEKIEKIDVSTDDNLMGPEEPIVDLFENQLKDKIRDVLFVSTCKLPNPKLVRRITARCNELRSSNRIFTVSFGKLINCCSKRATL